MSSYQCRKSHCGDKTVVRSSYLHNGISYTGKMSSLYWIRAQASNSYLISPSTKWPPFPWRHFEMHFHEWKFLYFELNFTQVCSQGSNSQYPSIGSDNGLAPIRRRAIIWTNVDPVHSRIHASLGLNELSWSKQADHIQHISINPGYPWQSIMRINSLTPVRCGFNFQTHFWDSYLEHFLDYLPQLNDMNDTGQHWFR